MNTSKLGQVGQGWIYGIRKCKGFCAHVTLVDKIIKPFIR